MDEYDRLIKIEGFQHWLCCAYPLRNAFELVMLHLRTCDYYLLTCHCVGFTPQIPKFSVARTLKPVDQ